MFSNLKTLMGRATTCIILPQFRNVSVSAPKLVKQIVVKKEGNQTIIEGTILPSPRESNLLKPSGLCNDVACPVCRLNLDVKHTDVLILSQFMRSDGGMIPRRITGLCRLQQRRMSSMVTMALKAGLMPNLGPPSSKRDPARRDKFKKNHRYFDESTIRPPRPLKHKIV